jgi:hypothetical protein
MQSPQNMMQNLNAALQAAPEPAVAVPEAQSSVQNAAYTAAAAAGMTGPGFQEEAPAPGNMGMTLGEETPQAAGSELARARALAQRLGITNLTDDEYDIPTYMRRQEREL